MRETADHHHHGPGHRRGDRQTHQCGPGQRRRAAAVEQPPGEQRQQQATDEREQNLDAILAKVKATGIGSLTAAERRFLETISAQKSQGR